MTLRHMIHKNTTRKTAHIKSVDVFRTLTNIYDGAFYENSAQLKVSSKMFDIVLNKIV